jgi:mono/diheme cytochrome c family protein
MKVRSPIAAVIAGAVIAAAGIAGGIVALSYAAGAVGGFSSRGEPTRLERIVARLARRWAVPSRGRRAQNPVPFTPISWAEGRAHFADHCATCHANDGSGQTELGRSLYPKAPDMRTAYTQNLTDGELYYIIENGVRLTGMPAWGSGRDDDLDTWRLVHFVRHLADLTPEDLKEMETLNPKSPAELQEEQDDERFLRGDDVQPSGAQAPHHNHKGDQ